MEPVRAADAEPQLRHRGQNYNLMPFGVGAARAPPAHPDSDVIQADRTVAVVKMIRNLRLDGVCTRYKSGEARLHLSPPNPGVINW